MVIKKSYEANTRDLAARGCRLAVVGLGLCLVRYIVVSAAAAGIEATSGQRIIDRICVTRDNNQSTNK